MQTKRTRDQSQAGRKPADPVRWIDGFDPCLGIGGLGWKEEIYRLKRLRRVPESAVPALAPALRKLSYYPSSAYLAFSTDAARILVRYRLRDPEYAAHMPVQGACGTELFRKQGSGWIPIAAAGPKGRAVDVRCELICQQPRGDEEYRLYLPLGARIERLAIGVPHGSRVRPGCAESARKPVLVYGSSIVQGGCASTAGADYVSVLGRSLDREFLNMGFSGSALGEAAVARMIREIDAGMFLLDYAPNCTAKGFRRSLPIFTGILREAHPKTPIVFVGNIGLNLELHDRKTRLILEEKREILMHHFLRCRGDGDRHVYFIDGPGLLPPGVPGASVDGIHPTSLGFSIMAHSLLPQLRSIFYWEELR